MKKTACLLFIFITLLQANAQRQPTPDTLWGKLFEEVQTKRVLPDNKTFVDALPKGDPAAILSKYNTLKASDSAFDLKAFVAEHFVIPSAPNVKVQGDLSLKGHLESLWDVLTRKADVKQPYSSLLPLPQPYVVPGGRFREIYYWDSYFTMLGLAESNRYDLIENMLDNFKWLIDNYGHIPNGNRTYYLSRSQPPYYALMVDLLAQKRGDSVYRKYYSAMEKEYQYWMQGAATLKTGEADRRVVKLPNGTVLNRYWDDKKAPREESYAEDIASAKAYKGTDGLAYTHLRAGAESGWDFSSRWFGDTLHLTTIETTNILPVDLNCLMYAYEQTLSKAAKASAQQQKATYYSAQALKRRAALLNYFWNEKLGYFFDYHFKDKKTTNKWSAAGIMPLFTKVASAQQAAKVQQHIEQKFLKQGGIVTTLYHTGQQWDAPNGWAPLQYIAVQGSMNYGNQALAKKIAERWMAVNEKVFATTGKMLEKYNVENTSLESGGGEYPTQDGFGWTNGVYLKLYSMFKEKEKQNNKRAF